MADLFGRYCYIDTPWIAGKRTRYRVIGSGVRSNAWCEVPVTGRTELIHHDNMEEVVFVVLDTLVSDDSIIRRFAIKDVDVMPADVVTSQWVLTKDDLPKNDDFMIVTILDKRGDTPFRYTDLGWYFDRAKCWVVDAEHRNDIVAWMPLPKPYKGGDAK